MLKTEACDAIVDGLVHAGFTTAQVELAGVTGLVASRTQPAAVAMRLHEFVVVFEVDQLSAEGAARLADAAQDYAIAHKGGLPRGLQTGTMTMVVLVDDGPQDSAVRWVDRAPIHRFAALRLAVLVDVGSDEIVFWDGRWVRGWVYRDATLDLVRTTVRRPLEAHAGTALTQRRAPGSDEDKAADARLANQRTMHRHTLGIGSASVLIAVAALYAIGGLGPALTALVLGVLAVGLAWWGSTRI